MQVESLPHLNVFLNAASAVLLLLGYRAIRRRDVPAHTRWMVMAFISSTLFLASYLTYHFHVLHRPYTGTGWLRAVYLAILASHIVLAIVALPLVITTFILALLRRYDRHRRLARWTFPIWLYVSVTGVVVYVMLYV